MNFFANINSNNIAIDIGMGGIVLRESDRLNPQRRFGGLITLGSPNRGGAVINAMQNGEVQSLFQEGCTEMSQASGVILLAIAVDMPYTNNLLFFTLQSVFAVAGATLVTFQNLICHGLYDDILRYSLPTAAAPQTATDLAEGSNIINMLNDPNLNNTPTFKIGVYGVENSPVHMRVASSLKNRPFVHPLDQANTDEELVRTFHNVNDVLNILGIAFAAIAIVQAVNSLWNWPLLFSAAINAWASYECSDAARWIAQSESKWHQLIGAGGFYTETRVFRSLTSVCQLQLDDAIGLYEQQLLSRAQLALIQQQLMFDPNCFENAVYPIYIPINNESDGLFHAGTEQIPNDPLSTDHVVNLRVEEVNHQEFFNHRNMTQLFRDIFEGRTTANRFFMLQ